MLDSDADRFQQGLDHYIEQHDGCRDTAYRIHGQIINALNGGGGDIPPKAVVMMALATTLHAFIGGEIDDGVDRRALAMAVSYLHAAMLTALERRQ